METNCKGHKTINQLCREYDVTDIWELSNLFDYWLECGNRESVTKNFSLLRKSERNLLWRFWFFNTCYFRIANEVLDIVLPIDKCITTK